MFLLVVVALAMVFVVLAYRRQWDWTGLTEVRRARGGDEDVQPTKTLWDWLQLLVIPLALAGLAFVVNEAQTQREQRREDDRAKLKRAVSTDAAHEDTLRAYLTQMSGLMLDRRLLRSKRLSDVQAVARTATLTAVRRLDGERRGLAIKFLDEARLLKRGAAKVNLAGADLRSADLRGANLSRDDLSEADLRSADLGDVNLFGAMLSRADLRGADLRGADLHRAHLQLEIFPSANSPIGDALPQLRGRALLLDTNLQAADLRSVNLLGAILSDVDLRRADLRHADLQEARLHGADLRHADLEDTDLRRADLRGADLRRAGLEGADLRGADLRGAELRGARGANLQGAHLK
ncbi:MAG TPA: pentapeptide repeat-containing protein [Solirubrobacteraceae bacterium]|nr:pentapeptide repeat-containing protein [Solirubrobacteraceae bacterium]